MRLSDYDASFLYGESPNTPMHAITIATVAGKHSLEEVSDWLAQRLHGLPRLRQKLAFVPFNIAHPMWIDDVGFDLSNHLSYEKLKGNSAKEPIPYVLDLVRPLLDRSRPLWRLHVLQAKDKTLLVGVVHHALIGTGSALDFLNNFFELYAQPKVTPDAPAWTPEPTPQGLTLTSQAILENTQNFSERTSRLGSLRNKTELVGRATESLTRFITEPVHISGWNRRLVGAKRTFRALRFSSADVRKIKNVCGGTINDVVVSIAVEAAARYQEKQGESAAERHLRIMQPVVVRREDENGVRENRMSAIFPVYDAEPVDMLKRLKEVRWETESIKINREAQALQLLMELAPPLPPLPTMGSTNNLFSATQFSFTSFNPISWLQQFSPNFSPVNQLFDVVDRFSSTMAGFNFTLSTVPGAQTTQYFAGSAVESVHNVPVLAANLGMGISIVNYDQSVYFNISADPELLEDLPLFVDLVSTCFTELQSNAVEHAA